MQTSCDILTFDITMVLYENATFMEFFTNGDVLITSALNVLYVISGVGNLGIDFNEIRVVYRIELLPTMTGISQEYVAIILLQCKQ